MSGICAPLPYHTTFSRWQFQPHIYLTFKLADHLFSAVCNALVVTLPFCRWRHKLRSLRTRHAVILRVTQNNVWLHVRKITRTAEDEMVDTAADTKSNSELHRRNDTRCVLLLLWATVIYFEPCCVRGNDFLFQHFSVQIKFSGNTELSRLLGFLMQLTAINSLIDRPSRRVSSTYHRFSF